MLMAALMAMFTTANAWGVPPGPQIHPRQELVATLAGESVAPVQAGQAVTVAGFELTAPAQHATFVSQGQDALISVVEQGQSDTVGFGLPANASAELQADGSVLLTERATEGDITAQATVEVPWAKDSTGRSLPTSYSLQGGTLVQKVDTAGASFPVVADPRLTYGRGVYLNVTGLEGKALATAIIGIGGLVPAWGCDRLRNLGGKLGGIARIACQFLPGEAVASVLNSIKAMWANKSGTYVCYQKRIVGPSTGWYTVAMKNCTG